jgi:hypothetical protein
MTLGRVFQAVLQTTGLTVEYDVGGSTAVQVSPSADDGVAGTSARPNNVLGVGWHWNAAASKDELYYVDKLRTCSLCQTV